jgi:hypothetical protein
MNIRRRSFRSARSVQSIDLPKLAQTLLTRRGQQKPIRVRDLRRLPELTRAAEAKLNDA